MDMSETSLTNKPYHPKRPHHKSRRGCRNCKTRKVGFPSPNYSLITYSFNDHTNTNLNHCRSNVTKRNRPAVPAPQGRSIVSILPYHPLRRCRHLPLRLQRLRQAKGFPRHLLPSSPHVNIQLQPPRTPPTMSWPSQSCRSHCLFPWAAIRLT
jgi:hypothetical protein